MEAYIWALLNQLAKFRAVRNKDHPAGALSAEWYDKYVRPSACELTKALMMPPASMMQHMSNDRLQEIVAMSGSAGGVWTSGPCVDGPPQVDTPAVATTTELPNGWEISFYPAADACPDCKGTGRYHGFTSIEDCQTCKGSGKK